jgi:asparagine synthetase B (glutamine-hydrolysing)
MPGIVGLISEEVNEQRQFELEQMVQRLDRSSHLQVDRVSDERCALAVVRLSWAGASLASKNGTWLAFFGSLVDFDCLNVPENQNGSSVNAASPGIASLLLDHYLSGGIRSVSDLNGTFSIAIWEAKDRKLTLLKDRYGYTNLYYWASAERFMFGSEYKTISWHPRFRRVLSPVAASDVMLYRFMPGQRTLFTDIQSVPQATIFTYQHGRIDMSTYWRPSFFVPWNKPKSDKEYAGELYERLDTAVRRRIKPDTSLLVTGGLDSRTILGLHHQAGPDSGLQTLTVGLPTGDDVIIGRELAEKIQVPHHHLPIDDSYLARFSAQIVWLAEGKTGAYASWILAALPFLYQHEQKYVLSGLFGNFVSGRHYPPGLARARTLQQGEEIVQSFIGTQLKELKEIMRPEVFREAGMQSARYITDTYTQPTLPDLFQRFDDFMLNWLFGSAGNTGDVFNDVSLPLEPFLDNDVIDYAMGCIPPANRMHSLFYQEMIVKFLPEMAAVRYGRTGRSVEADLRLGQNPLMRWGDDKVQRALKRIFPSRYQGDARRSVPHVGAIQGGSRPFVQQVLSSEAYLEDLFDIPAIHKMLDDHIAGRRNAYMTLDSLVTLAIWRQQFCDLNSPLPLPESYEIGKTGKLRT